MIESRYRIRPVSRVSEAVEVHEYITAHCRRLWESGSIWSH